MTYQGKTKGIGMAAVSLKKLAEAARRPGNEASVAARKAREARSESERLMQKSRQQKVKAVTSTVAPILGGIGAGARAGKKLEERIRKSRR